MVVRIGLKQLSEICAALFTEPVIFLLGRSSVKELYLLTTLLSFVRQNDKKKPFTILLMVKCPLNEGIVSLTNPAIKQKQRKHVK